MKKYLICLSVLVLLMCLLCSCKSAQEEKNKKENEPVRIVTTVFPEYDWVQNIIASNPGGMEVTLLVDNGVDLHSYQPSVDDIIKITDCDMFIYVGGESDKWVSDALAQTSNKNRTVISLLDILGDSVREEEETEGMQSEEKAEDGEDKEDGPEYDEHVWLSLKNASKIVDKISECLQKLDEKNAAVYRENTAAYKEKLNVLDEEYTALTKDAPVKTLLFGDRFPFLYLTKDYGLSYYAAFPGCSAETEASFNTITFLSEKLNSLSLPAVLTIENSDAEIAETIVKTSGKADVKILTLNSAQSVTSKDIKDGVTYLSIMKDNLEVLKTALGK